MQSLLLYDDSEICLCNNFSHKCLGLNRQKDTMTCDYPPAFIHEHSDDTINSEALHFRVSTRDLHSTTTKSKSSPSSTILTDGCELKFDKKSSNEEMNKLLLKASTWTIHIWKKKVNNNQISLYDEFCLRSATNAYMTCHQDYHCYGRDEIHQQNSIWTLILADVPSIPLWVYSRPSLSKFMNIAERSGVQVGRQSKLLKSHNPEIQQALLVEDLLDVMLGFDGVYIRRRAGTYQFGIELHMETPTCNIALAQLTMKILALPSHYYILENYISTYNIQQGIICQALCGGLRVLVKEYKMMVVQLDDEVKNGLTLQKIWYYIQPSLKIMESLTDLIKEAQKLKGGQLLSCLAKMVNQNTDQQIVSIYNFLFNRAIKLYMGMICKWIYKGVLEDKHDQFMIQGQVQLSNVQSVWQHWDDRFHLRKEQIPSLFQKDSQMILITGKYLNVLKKCGKTVEHPYHQDIQNNINHYITLQNFTQPIRKAYQWANQQLKTLVFEQCRLNDVLKSLKGYYFLYYGDLYSYFMDATEEELNLPFKNKTKDSKKQIYKQFSITKINNLFELLIRTSSANNDYFKDEVKCSIDGSNLYDQIERIKIMQSNNFEGRSNERYLKKDSRYVDYLNLEYHCHFPINLVIDSSAISKYQVLFRFLFWLKFIERQLNGVWLTLQATKEVSINGYRCAYQLTQKMITCVKNITYYLSYEVIQPKWQHLTMQIQNAENFQQLIQYHNQFLNQCLTQSMLMSNELLAIITGDFGNSFQGFLKIKEYITRIHEGRSFIPYPNEHQSMLTQRRKHLKQVKLEVLEWFQQNNFQKFVSGYDHNYSESMKKLLRRIYDIVGKKDNYLLNFLARLDEGKYYNQTIFNNHVYSIDQ